MNKQTRTWITGIILIIIGCYNLKYGFIGAINIESGRIHTIIFFATLRVIQMGLGLFSMIYGYTKVSDNID